MSKLTLLALFVAPLALGALLLAADGPAEAPKSEAPKAEAPKTEAPKAASTDPAKPAEAASAAKKYPDQDPQKGSLEGQVTIDGDAPTLEAKVIPPGHQDHAACIAHLKEERWILSDKKEVKDVVVSVLGYKPAEKVKPRELTLDNKGCTFVPHISATTVGSALTVTNSDAFVHNTHANLALQANFAVGPGQSETKKLPKDGWVAINCDFHPWMFAHIKVFAHDLFDLTSTDGAYKIANIPPGEYEIEIWHEYPLVATKQKVKIEAGKATKLDVALKVVPPKK